MKPIDIAKVCHEINRAYCFTLGDLSQVPWEEAEEWQTSSALKGVIYHLHNPESTPADSHKSWLAEKEADGWKYGTVKDPEKKEHPCMVPFEQLPVPQQGKDVLFLTTVRQLEKFLLPEPTTMNSAGGHVDLTSGTGSPIGRAPIHEG